MPVWLYLIPKRQTGERGQVLDPLDGHEEKPGADLVVVLVDGGGSGS